MGAAVVVARAELRARWRALVVIVLLVGIGGGLSVSLVAGARRSGDVFDRFEAAQQVGDISVQPDVVDGERLAELRADPAIAAAAPYAVIFARVEGTDVDPMSGSRATVATDGTYGTILDQSVLVAGTPLDQTDEGAVQVSAALAEEVGLELGETVRIETISAQQVADVFFEGLPIDEPAGPTLDLRVTTIVRPVYEVLSGVPLGEIVLPQALWQEYGEPLTDEEPSDGETIGGFDNILLARSAHGDVDAALAAARRVFAGDDELFVDAVEQQFGGSRDLARVMAIALLLGAAVVAVATVVAVTQAIARQLDVTSDQAESLAAIGVTRRDRTLAVGLPFLAVAVGGAVFASGLAIALSGRFPYGDLRPVEPDPGLHVDAAVLLAGIALVLVLVVVGTAPAARRAQRLHPPRRSDRRSLAVPGGSLVATTAARLASARGVPRRPAIGGAIAALAGVAAAMTFGASLTRFVDEPARDGWAWDAEVGIADGLDDASAVEDATAIAAERVVDGVLYARVGSLDVGERHVETQTFGLEPIEGDVTFVVLSGRLPAGLGEVAVGADTADDNDVGVGDSVTVESIDGPVDLEVTGIVRLPLGNSDNPASGLVLTLDALTPLVPSPSEDGNFGYPTSFVDLAPGVSIDDAAATTGRAVAGVETNRSTDALNLGKVVHLPSILAAMLAALGILAVYHALVVVVRRERHDLAVLRALGFVPRQVRRVVEIQSFAYGAFGLLVGIPLGIIVGRWTWRLHADGLGIAHDPLTPSAVLLVVPATVVVCGVLATLPARAAVRTAAAGALHDE